MYHERIRSFALLMIAGMLFLTGLWQTVLLGRIASALETIASICGG